MNWQSDSIPNSINYRYRITVASYNPIASMSGNRVTSLALPLGSMQCALLLAWEIKYVDGRFWYLVFIPSTTRPYFWVNFRFWKCLTRIPRDMHRSSFILKKTYLLQILVTLSILIKFILEIPTNILTNNFTNRKDNFITTQTRKSPHFDVCIIQLSLSYTYLGILVPTLTREFPFD